jgi:hypothetical protein
MDYINAQLSVLIVENCIPFVSKALEFIVIGQLLNNDKQPRYS